MRLRLRLLLPLVLALLAGLAQYGVLNMFEAGRRQGVWVVTSTLFVASMAVYGIPRLKVSKVWQFAIFVVAPAIAACTALLVAEKMDRPEITIVFRPGGLTVVALTIFVAGGWLVGLAAFCGSIFARAKKEGHLPARPTFKAAGGLCNVASCWRLRQMRYVIGSVLIALGFFHGLHVWGIEPGSVINLNGSRFLSFAALDRLASVGLAGKLLVLLIDGFVIALGVLEVTGRSRFVRRRKAKKPTTTPTNR